MEIAYNQILLLLLQCLLIALLLASLFRLRRILGMALLYITLGVFQFLQVFLASSLVVEVVSGIFISSGSMVLFTASLFMILLVYLREGTFETRKIIYALLAANLVTSLLLFVFGWSTDNSIVTNIYNLPKEFFSQNIRILLVGTAVMLLDALLIIYFYEIISKYIGSLFVRTLFTMTIVLGLDTVLFSLGVYWSSDQLSEILISGLVSKTLAALVYSSFFPLYLILFDQNSTISESKDGSFKDVFNAMTFRQKYENVFREMKIKTQELLETQKLAQLGSYILDVKTGLWTSSVILDDIFGIDSSYKRDVDGWLKLIYSEDQAMMNEYLSVNILTNKEKFNKEYRVLNKKKDQTIWVHGMGDLIFDSKGNLVKMNGTIQDITERKNAELELIKRNDDLIILSTKLSEKNRLIKENQRKYKNIFDKNPISLWEEDFSVVRQMLKKKQTETSDLKQYIDENPDFVLECISKLKILNVNDITLELLGFNTKEELLTQLGKAFNERSFEGFKRQLIAVAQNQQEFSSESELVRSDGKVINVLIKLVNIRDENSNAILSVIDITELNKAKEKIVKSERKFRELYERSADAIFIFKNGMFIECNQSAVNLFGYKTNKNLINKDPVSLSPAFQPDGQNSQEKSMVLINEAILKGSIRFEWTHLNFEGKEFPTEVLLTVISNEPDNLVVHAVLRDITEGNRAKAELQKSEDRFQFFANASFEGIGMAVDGIITDTNKRLTELTGYSRKELIDQSLMMLIYPEDKDFVGANIKKGFEGVSEFRILRKDGAIQYVESRGRNINFNGKNTRIVNLYDISDRVKIKENLIESERKFKSLFDNSPVSLWKEDFSVVKKLIDEKKSQTNDLKKYLDENPDFVFECVSKVKILNVNNITLDLFGVINSEELLSHLSNTFNEKSFEVFKNELLALASNEKEFSAKTEFIRSDGKTITALIKFLIIDDDYEKAIVSIVDITELNEAQKKIVENQRKFKKLFDRNPVSLWEVDFHEIKKTLDNKKTQTRNFKKYLDDNRDFVMECVAKIEVLDVNEVSLDLLGANTKTELINNLGNTFNENTLEVFKEHLLSIASNEKEFYGETEFTRSSGEIITTFLKYVKIDDTNDRGIISIIDITELNKAKEKIVESEKRFRELYEKSGDAILILKNGIFVECNQAAVDMLEYQSKEEFLNSHPSKLSPIFQQDGQKSYDKAIDMMNLALKEGTHRFEWIHIKKNGNNFPVEVLLTAISNEPNNQVIHTVWRDITDRKNAELELKMSERELRKSHEIAQLGNFTIDLTSDFMNTSSVFDAIVGFRTSDIKSFDELRKRVHPEDLEENLKMFQNCLETGKLFDREFRIINGISKKLKWIHGLGEILYKENEPSIFRGTLQDITERKLNELAVKLNEKKLLETQKIANLGTYEIDLRKNSVTTSELYNSILGFKKTPHNNKGWWKSITHPDDYERSQLLWKECISTGKTYKDEYRIINDKNEIKWIYDVAEVKINNGTPYEVVGTIQDITIRKLSEEKIRRSDSILSQVNSLVQVVDKKGNITYASPSFKTILGFEPEDMLGQGWWIKTTPNKAAATKLRNTILDVVNNDTPIPDEIKNRWIKAENGQSKLFDWINSKGADDSLIFIGIEITEKQEREKQFKTLTETAQDAIILVDHNGLIYEWNKSSEETFGYLKKEVVGKPITLLMPKRYRTQYKKGFDKVMKSTLKNTYRNNVVEGLTKYGKVFPMELSISFWESNNENVYCYFIRDITERVREEKIKEVLFNITQKANNTLTLDKFFKFVQIELGKLINTNNFFVAIHDEKTDMISTPFMVDEIDVANDFPKGETLTGHIIDTKKALLTKDVVLERNKGDSPIGLGPESQCWLGVPILLEEKAIGAIVVQSYTNKDEYSEEDIILLELVASNISQVIKQVEDFEKINMLNQALIQTPAMVMITNNISKLEYVNPSFTTITGYESEEVIGKNPKFLNPEINMKDFYKNVEETIKKGGYWRDEIVNIKKDGSRITVTMSIAPVKDSNDQITHYVVVEEDITEKRKLQRQFINAFIDAQEVEKQNFGEELHDGISQILSAESMYINLLIEQNQDGIHDKAKFLTKIKELNSRAVNETRTIAHGLMSSQLKQSGLLIAVENICIDFNSAKKIEFSFVNNDVKEEDLSKEIKTNLYRIIQELTTNINRYSSARKASIIFSNLNHSKISVTVKDNGIGLDYEKIKKERKVTGLKNVERRIIFLNGTFEVESAPKKGTAWNIVIPL